MRSTDQSSIEAPNVTTWSEKLTSGRRIMRRDKLVGASTGSALLPPTTAIFL